MVPSDFNVCSAVPWYTFTSLGLLWLICFWVFM